MGLKKLLFVVTLLISVTGFAQAPEEIDSTTVAIAVDIKNISFEVESTQLILQAHALNEYDHRILDELDSLVNIKSKEILKEFKDFENQPIAGISKSGLDALVSSWNLNKKLVDKGVLQVRELFEKTNNSIETLKTEREKWIATYRVLSQSESPEALILKVTNLIVGIENTEEQLKKNLATLVNVESAIIDVSGVVSAVQVQLKKAGEQRSKDIFVQNSPAIWNIWSDTDTSIVSIPLDTNLISKPDHSFFDELFNKMLREKVKVSADFFKSHENSIYFHIILWILTVTLTLRYGGKVELSYSNEKKSFLLQAMDDVQKRLIPSATYISVLYAVIIYDYIPLLITEILVLILIILNVIILHKSKGKKITKVALLLALVYVLGQINMESRISEFSFRWFLFLKIGITFWVLQLFIKFLKSYKTYDYPKLWWRLNRLVWLSYFLLMIGVLSNILGFVKLTNLSSLLVIQLIVVSFIFYGILLTSNGLISLFFRAGWAPKKESSIEFRNSIEGMVIKGVNIIAIWFWVRSILGTVGIYEIIKKIILDIFVASVKIGSISISIQEVFSAIIVVAITFSLTRFIGILITEGGLDTFKLKRGVPNAISLVVRYTLIVLGVLLALTVAGIDLSNFSLMAGALGIGIGFGLQNIISNFVSGLILVFERPLQEGDVVEVNNLLGIVKSIGVRSSNIRTYTGSEVVVPNEVLISKELINWTLSDPNKRIEIKVGVDYGSDPRLIIKLLKEAAEANTNVQKDPAPSVYFVEFGESSLNFRLLFWVHNSISLSTRSDVMLRVSDTLRANNIKIPFPIRTLKVDKDLVSGELIKDPRKTEDYDAGNSEK